MKFDKRFLAKMVPEMKQYYMDYQILVEQIRLVRKAAYTLGSAFADLNGTKICSVLRFCGPSSKDSSFLTHPPLISSQRTLKTRRAIRLLSVHWSLSSASGSCWKKTCNELRRGTMSAWSATSPSFTNWSIEPYNTD